MRRRLYFLVPNRDVAAAIVDELLLARLEERHMHVLAREDTPLGDLPKADLRQKSDLLEAAERGMAVGGATGLVAGLVAVTFPPAGVDIGGGVVATITLAGVVFGAWASTLIGIRIPNREIDRYQKAIEEGRILMMLDVRKKNVEAVEALVKKHHPDVKIADEPHKPAFP